MKNILIIFLLLGVGWAEQLEPVQIQADRFEVDISSNQFVAQDKVVISQGDILITSKRATYTSKRDFINIEGDVVLIYQELNIKADTILFDRIKQVMTAEGHLQVNNRDLDVNAERLRYDVKPSIILFQGATTVTQKQNVIRGRDIIYDVKKRKLSSSEKTLMRLESVPSKR